MIKSERPLKNFIRQYKIPIPFLLEKMGYSRVHFSKVINYKTSPSDRFIKLFLLSCVEYMNSHMPFIDRENAFYYLRDLFNQFNHFRGSE